MLEGRDRETGRIRRVPGCSGTSPTAYSSRGGGLPNALRLGIRVRPSATVRAYPSRLKRDQTECERDDIREMSEVARRPAALLGALVDTPRPLNDAGALWSRGVEWTDPARGGVKAP